MVFKQTVQKGLEPNSIENSFHGKILNVLKHVKDKLFVSI